MFSVDFYLNKIYIISRLNLVMEVRRIGNMDMHLIMSGEELSKLELMTEKGVAFTSKLETYHPQDSLKGTEVQLVYDPNLTVDGLDGRDVVSHFDNPPIPIYIGNRGIVRLQQGDYCGGAVFDTKIEIKVQKS